MRCQNGNLCPQCGSDNPLTAKFCGQFASPLGLAPSAPTPVKTGDASAPAASQVESAERRQLTVLFCDLVGSIDLSMNRDPEELREIVLAYQETCAQAVGIYDGHIAQYLGDGLMIYFGFPQAHEDDDQRAIRSALGILEGMESLDARLQLEKNVRLNVRIGIHTGLVVVGEVGAGDTNEDLAMGSTPNIAARLEAMAEPNTVVIGAATHRLTLGFFNFNTLGEHTLRGTSDPMKLYSVSGDTGARGRLDAVSEMSLTPLAGRETEIRFLFEQWTAAASGVGNAILIKGEAGMVPNGRDLKRLRTRF